MPIVLTSLWERECPSSVISQHGFSVATVLAAVSCGEVCGEELLNGHQSEHGAFLPNAWISLSSEDADCKSPAILPSCDSLSQMASISTDRKT